MTRYRDIETIAPDYEPLPFYSSDLEDDLDLAERLRASMETQQSNADLASFLSASRPGPSAGDGETAADGEVAPAATPPDLGDTGTGE
jgi:hypothetical protein